MHKAQRFIFLALALVGLCPVANGASARDAIHVQNYKDGAEIRHPVPLLRGSLSDANETSMVVVNTSSKRETRVLPAVVHRGKFKALTELVPGENKLILRAGKNEFRLTLHYRPQTNPHFVRVIYMTDNAGETDYQTPLADDPQDYIAKLDTAMKLMQTFTAERLNDLGYGRRTFNLEYDDDGKVKIHTLRGDHPAKYYYQMSDGQWWGHVNGWVGRKFPGNKAKNVVLAAYTRFDPKTRKALGHTALGGGRLGLFGSGDLFTWPSNLGDVFRAFTDERRVDRTQFFDDSAGRGAFWAVASTTIGATLHELTHTFGVPHCRDGMCMMTRGFDHFNRVFTFVEPPHRRRNNPYEFPDDRVAYFAPISAANLVYSRWFALDAREYEDENRPSIHYDEDLDKMVIEAAHGIRYVGIDVRGDARDYMAFLDDKEPPKRLTFSAEDLQKRVGADNVRLRVVDSEGMRAGASTTRLASVHKFVRRWRFSTITKPWENKDAFVSISEDDLSSIVAAATSAPLVGSRDSFVDFLPRFREKQSDVAGYAVRTIVSDDSRKVKILTGSDDALRVWLNGKLVIQRLLLRPAEPDRDSTTVELRPGKNVLVAEVSQAGGGWGLYLRLEDENGKGLRVTEDGKLIPVDRR